MDTTDFISEVPSVEEVIAYRQEVIQEHERKGKLFAKAYSNKMEEAIRTAIQTLMDNPNKFSCTLNLDSSDLLFDNEGHYIFFHVVHYGGTPVIDTNGCCWTKRQPIPMFVNLFKELQTALLERDYYLLDISDPLKSHSLVIKLYMGKPKWYDDVHVLWHKLNKI